MTDFDDLRRRWLQKDLSACSQLAATVPDDRRAAWATETLAAFLQELPAPDEVLNVVVIGEHPARRQEAHRAFDAVRVLTLEFEARRFGTQRSVDQLLLYLAENAARVIYNSTSPPDPFDSDSAAYLLLVAADLLGVHRSTEMENRIWDATRATAS